MAKLRNKNLTRVLVFILVVGWIFSGWPQVWNFPSEVETAQASHCTVSPCTITATETFTVPAGVTSLDIIMWGGGAAGSPGSATQTRRGGGGGGGGAYTACTIAVTAETGYTVTVGALVSSGNGNASSFVGNDGTCTANAGATTVNHTAGAGGAAQAVGGVVTAASAGGAGVNSNEGGGGGGGEGGRTTGTGGVGTDGSGSTGGAGGTGGDGGDGGRGGDDTGTNITSGTAPGGGGGGAGGNSNTVGGGARGEMTLTWTVAAATLTQNNFWFYSDNNQADPVDIWGVPALTENSPLNAIPATNQAPTSTEEIRIRMNFTVANTLSADSVTLKLQYATSTIGSLDCSTETAGNFKDVEANGTTAAWYFAASGVTDGATLVTSLTGSDTGKYAKTNTVTNPGATNAQDVEFDWHIQHNAADAQTYCFRVVKSTGNLDAYNSDSYPRITTAPGAGNLLRHGNFFDQAGEKGFFWAD